MEGLNNAKLCRWGIYILGLKFKAYKEQCKQEVICVISLTHKLPTN
jgi:hypothetical protein